MFTLSHSSQDKISHVVGLVDTCAFSVIYRMRHGFHGCMKKAYRVYNNIGYMDVIAYGNGLALTCVTFDQLISKD